METIRGFFRRLRATVSGTEDDAESDLPKYTFYDTIEEFGYHFNEKGELVDENGGRFKFVVKEGDRNYNQQHYDALGELITEYLYEKMETDLQLQKVYIPLDAKKEEPQGFIFQNADAAEYQTLMVIINGAGVVRAGQWSRKLIINEGLEVGSQFPYIRRALDAGFGVMVLNTNQNQQMVNGKATDIRGSSSAEEHALYVWEHIISKTKAANIVIVAHSYGGLVTCTMAEQFLEEFKKRVFCIVFTDSVHTVARDRWSEPVRQFLMERAVNFAAAYVPLDYMMQASAHSDCLSVSAGTEEHERTSHACFDSAFTFINDNLATWTADHSMAPRRFKPLPEDLSQFSCAARWQRKMEKVAAEEGDSSSSVDEVRPQDSTSSENMPPLEAKKRSVKEDEKEEGEEREKLEEKGEEREKLEAEAEEKEKLEEERKKLEEKREEREKLEEKREEREKLEEKREEREKLEEKREEREKLEAEAEEREKLEEEREEREKLEAEEEEREKLEEEREEREKLEEKREEREKLEEKREEREKQEVKGEEREKLEVKGEEREKQEVKGEQRKKQDAEGEQRKRQEVEGEQRKKQEAEEQRMRLEAEGGLSENGKKEDQDKSPKPSCEQETPVVTAQQAEVSVEDEELKEPGLITASTEPQHEKEQEKMVQVQQVTDDMKLQEKESWLEEIEQGPEAGEKKTEEAGSSSVAGETAGSQEEADSSRVAGETAGSQEEADSSGVAGETADIQEEADSSGVAGETAGSQEEADSSSVAGETADIQEEADSSGVAGETADIQEEADSSGVAGETAGIQEEADSSGVAGETAGSQEEADSSGVAGETAGSQEEADSRGVAGETAGIQEEADSSGVAGETAGSQEEAAA